MAGSAKQCPLRGVLLLVLLPVLLLLYCSLVVHKMNDIHGVGVQLREPVQRYVVVCHHRLKVEAAIGVELDRGLLGAHLRGEGGARGGGSQAGGREQRQEGQGADQGLCSRLRHS